MAKFSVFLYGKQAAGGRCARLNSACPRGMRTVEFTFEIFTRTNSLSCPLIISSFSCTIFSDIVCCLLSNVCVVTSFYQSLQAMSSFMRFSICATYCTLSKELSHFASGLEKDLSAVENAVASPLSNGFVEGTNSKLKMIKRTMYGRCGKELLVAKLILLNG